MLQNSIGFLIEKIIYGWINLTGRTVSFEKEPWLDSPMAESSYVGAEFYAYLAKKRNLTIQPTSDSGLLVDFNALAGDQFNPDDVIAEVKHFYEHTSQYWLEAWSQSVFPSRIFLWILTTFVSRRMNQLNFPVSSLELAGGMESEVLPMVDSQGNRQFTGWLRKLSNPSKVIYTGLYSTRKPPQTKQNCVKVSFPLPNGSSTVFLTPGNKSDGSFTLTSSGKGFGHSGYYRMVMTKKRVVRVRYLRTLKEHFHVYKDQAGTLRTDHKVRFLGLPVLVLHYKILKK